MPGTIPGILGVAAFGGIKFVGYSLAVSGLKKVEPTILSSATVIAGWRTGLGFVLGPVATISGVLLADALLAGHKFLRYENYVIYGILVIARIFIWALLLYIFTRKAPLPRSRFWGYSILGAVISSLLDIPGYALAFAAPGQLVFC